MLRGRLKRTHLYSLHIAELSKWKFMHQHTVTPAIPELLATQLRLATSVRTNTSIHVEIIYSTQIAVGGPGKRNG